MSLTSVKMSEDVWLTCLTHALSTETEEIMGLLLGDIQLSKNGSVTALIWGALPQPRSDRQKDRVETNPEQLTAASAMYQLLDSGFIGLIFSCFSEDSQKVGRIQVIAFQSLDGKQTMKPVSVTPLQKSPVIDIESSISSSDKSMGGGNMEHDTGDSKVSLNVGIITKLALPAGDEAKALLAQRLGAVARENHHAWEVIFVNDNSKTGNNSHANNSLGNAIQDLDPMDMSEGMQEAMHLSNFGDEVIGAEYIRKENSSSCCPPHHPSSSLDSPLSFFTNLQRVMFEEERTAYNQAMAQNASLSPAMSALQDRLRENEIKIRRNDVSIAKSEWIRGSGESRAAVIDMSMPSKHNTRVRFPAGACCEEYSAPKCVYWVTHNRIRIRTNIRRI
ncbi:lys-63-specific deubiquitinase brcc36 [Phtheirospermum japonicum]|uniref:Lys-63-specific deubiquitinase brcc36 n=1 Tax=Phtheirospermum japonicum TaxID=374723 RepID=A0A830CN85_9LAMI|nr:lys-63-specific deubiquitinase brcc36 [Phtheirospermum japonicum]